MGRIFKAMGLLDKGEVIEVDRSALVGQYVGETAQKTEKIIEESIGNVLFIDEAYTLVKKGQSNDFGQEAIDTLLKKMEDRKGDFFVIAAGYPNEMESFLESNPGLKSRFTHHFTFDDYIPDELIQIFKNLVKDEDYKLMNSAEILLQKELTNLYRKRDENFGNARTVRKIFEDIKIQVSKYYLSLPKHERNKDKLVTITEDNVRNVLGVNVEKNQYDVPVNEELLNEAMMELNKLTGLASVKNDVSELIKLAKFYRDSGENLSDKFGNHILFFGNPGTGKTTVARVIAKIYSALGILPSGQLVEIDRKGLVASHVGETANKTTEVINSAMGGTLFIDEAYTLVKEGQSNDFGQEAIDTLLKRMEDDRGKFIVVAAGYTDEMKKFLESNPGMKSRFTKTFYFEDYKPDELMTIFNSLSKNNNLKINDEAEKIVLNHFNELYRNRDKNFGNARLVRNLFEETNKQHTLRIVNVNQAELTPELKSTITGKDLQHISPNKKETKVEVKGDEEKLNKHLDELEHLTGLREVKDGVNKLINGLKISMMRKERGMQVVQKPLHAVFTGNPGTGKTTVARLLSSIFKELGVISKGHLVEVDRAQLVAGYSGQTAIKTDEVIQKSLGGTLFIDEAYTLSRGSNDFGQEAIDTLLKRMEDYKDQLIVIVAGYTNEMKQFLESNPGLTSRFVNKFHFEDYKPEELQIIANSMAASYGYEFNAEGENALIKQFEQLYAARDKNFGNARTARNLLLEIISNQEERLTAIKAPTDEDLKMLNEKDIVKK
jgi:SpoVK/Ycf46/Vps4 family AAA+-type ATPase